MTRCAAPTRRRPARRSTRSSRRLKERRIAVLLAGMLAPRNFGPGLCEGVRRDLSGARRRARPHPLSVHPRRRRRRPALNQGDGLHPTAAGVDVMVQGHAAEGGGACRAREAQRPTKSRGGASRSPDCCRLPRKLLTCLPCDPGQLAGPALRSCRCLACSPAWKSPKRGRAIAVAVARRAAGRALDRSGELPHHAALHRRHRRPPGARDRLAARRRAAAQLRGALRRPDVVRRAQAARHRGGGRAGPAADRTAGRA